MALTRRRARLLSLAMLTFVLPAGSAALVARRPSPASVTRSLSETAPQAPAAPWTPAQTVTADVLAKELANSRSASRPMVVYVGFRVLYRGGHVPTASLHGPAMSPEGLAELTRWAAGLPRSANLVVYCGCCPLAECPNPRPAFLALRDMGFVHLRVLILPTNFATDWIARGYPVERQ